MNLKRLFSMLFILVASATLFSVGCKAKQEAPKTEKPLEVAFLTNGPISDWGYNYAHDKSRLKMEENLKGKVKTSIIENVPETAEAERVMIKLIEKGTNLIVATSFGYQDTSVKLAKEFPNVKFLQSWGFKPADNLASYSAKMYESWYLMGIIAGRMTKTNRLGVVAAHPIPPMMWQFNAFVLGAKSVNPKVTASVTFINHWFDAALASDATDALINQKCDFVCGILDNSVAVAQTAEKRGVYFIGHNADLSKFAPKMHLAGTLWLWSGLYTKVAEDILNNQWKGEIDYNGGLDKGYVGITDFNLVVPQEVRDEVLNAKEMIASGKLAVY